MTVVGRGSLRSISDVNLFIPLLFREHEKIDCLSRIIRSSREKKPSLSGGRRKSGMERVRELRPQGAPRWLDEDCVGGGTILEN